MSLSFTIVGFLCPYMLVPYVVAQLFGSATGAWIAQVTVETGTKKFD